MSKLYIITEIEESEKSIIAKKVAEKSKRSALIEGDDIYDLVEGGYESPWKEGNHLKVFWKNIFDMIENFLEESYDVIFCYPVNKEKLEVLKEKFAIKKGIEWVEREVKFIVLTKKEKSYNMYQTRKTEFNPKNILQTSNKSKEEIVKTIVTEECFRIYQ